jgi:LysR family transcriptional activator of nhaA
MRVSSLNYHHLRYFWTVAREGSIVSASKLLGLSQPGISTQLKSLEEALGEQLFERDGRGLSLTEAGQLVFRYADEIFRTGGELLDALRGGTPARAPTLLVGVADVVPKLITHRLLEPALRMPTPTRVVCREDRSERLIDALTTHALDLLLTDAPVSGGGRAGLYNHLLGECQVTFFAVPALAKRLKRNFPTSLEGAPMLLPSESTSLRRALESWFQQVAVRPKVVGEFDDSALMKVFAQHGEGVCPAPGVIEHEVRASFGLVPVGRTREVLERFYAVSAERRIRHPAVIAISEHARQGLFGASSPRS